MLCRACGAEMMATEYCPSCNEAVLWKCRSCEKQNDKSVHTMHNPSPESSKTVSVVSALIGIASGIYVIPPISF